MLYRLSRLIPVRFRSTYEVRTDSVPMAAEIVQGPGAWRVERASWWQFRGHIFGHRRTLI
jgi:hypothetical protein